MGYFLIRTHLIQFLPIPQSSIANLSSTDVPQFPIASNMVGFIGMLSNPQRRRTPAMSMPAAWPLQHHVHVHHAGNSILIQHGRACC